jgi:hypothetical protein
MYRRRTPSRASQRAVDAGAAAEGGGAEGEALGRRRYIMPQSRKVM